MDDLQISLKPSRSLAALLAVTHALALGAACMSLEGWSLVLVSMGVSLSAFHNIRDALQRLPSSVLSIRLRPEGDAEWQDLRGGWHRGRLLEAGFVSAPLVVAGFAAPEQSRKWIALLPDAASQDELRRLRIWLRWRRGPRVSRGPSCK